MQFRDRVRHSARPQTRLRETTTPATSSGLLRSGNILRWRSSWTTAPALVGHLKLAHQPADRVQCHHATTSQARALRLEQALLSIARVVDAPCCRPTKHECNRSNDAGGGRLPIHD